MSRQAECIRCRAQMEDGYVGDLTPNGYRQQIWHPGEPQRSFWGGLKMKKELCVPVKTLRCPSCGYLESYAIKGSTSK